MVEQQRLAKLLDTRISRKVVKQTVMTTVYGVTALGAKQQILNRLEEVHEADGFNGPVERRDLPKMATYIAGLTLSSLGENFKGATESMAWLLKVARLISHESNMPVEWVTPLGWPVVQPYFRIKSRRVRTVFHDMVVMDEDELRHHENNARAPVMPYKQRQALPPNYVHSLDSSHMLLTAKACADAGLTFAAVHDSFWTHAADVPAMSAILREQFVALHSPPLMEDLEAQLHARHPDVRWSDGAGLRLPERGELDLERVRDSTYFFA